MHPSVHELGHTFFRKEVVSALMCLSMGMIIQKMELLKRTENSPKTRHS